MGQAKQRKAEIEQLKATGKGNPTQNAVRSLMLDNGYSASQTEQLYVANGANLIDFTDIDVGYKDFLSALHSIGFDWEYFKTHGGKATVLFAYSQSKPPIAQLAGSFPASTKCDNGAELFEFAVAASFFSIIEQSLKHLQSQITHKLCVPVMRYSQGMLTFVVMPA